MLTSLKVENLAVVEKTEATFGPGLNVITGETGAGKSVFTGALALALGARADAAAVRGGASEARIEAVFAFPEGVVRVGDYLAARGLPACEDGQLLLRRTINAKGGSRVWINDAPATVQSLHALGEMLVDRHGPGDNRSLAAERFQRDALDTCGGVNRTAYAAAWSAYADVASRLAALENGDVSGEELERLRFSVDELNEAALTEEDETELPARHAAAAHAEETTAAAGAAAEALDGDGASAGNALGAAIGQFRAMARHCPEAADWTATAERILGDVRELSRTVAETLARMDADPASLAALDERLSLVQRLKRKYRRNTVGELLSLLAERTARLSDLENLDARRTELGTERDAAFAAVRTAGAALTAARRTAAAKLARKVTGELKGLGFAKARLEIRVEPREPEASGCDRIAYVFEPNPGEPPRELAAIASSGELARVMLALKTVMARHDAADVLVFDEVDANVGGETAHAVGARLKDVAKHRQVIAITHLPQTAACGDRHFAVAKSVTQGRTRSVIREVSGKERTAELARMLGGGAAALAHAREMSADA